MDIAEQTTSCSESQQNIVSHSIFMYGFVHVNANTSSKLTHTKTSAI
jgi:hypothetical protein